MLERNLSSPPPPHAVRVMRGGFVAGYLLARESISSIMGDGDRGSVFDETMERSSSQNEPSSVTASGDGLEIATETDSGRRVIFV